MVLTRMSLRMQGRKHRLDVVSWVPKNWRLCNEMSWTSPRKIKWECGGVVLHGALVHWNLWCLIDCWDRAGAVLEICRAELRDWRWNSGVSCEPARMVLGTTCTSSSKLCPVGKTPPVQPLILLLICCLQWRSKKIFQKIHFSFSKQFY